MPVSISNSSSSIRVALEGERFQSRHIGPDATERDAMLAVIGAPSLDTLIDEAIPDRIRLRQPLAIADGSSGPALRIANVGTGGSNDYGTEAQQLLPAPLEAGKKYRVSAVVRGASGGEGFYLLLWNGAVIGSKHTNVTATPQTVSFELTPTSTAMPTLLLRSTIAGGSVLVSSVQVEEVP